ncbi:hypothetical protein GIB67_035683 [Kingdonia uniflora]|uniref:Retrotransposon gag domain-containing protein n=1 Tax=Kingdonia uniflora TaxID=39325 RepID=A0A7J7MJ16_9MAGN|nr:hypothetical protein GIB67_035683 [Kingdonia uniflora]
MVCMVSIYKKILDWKHNILRFPPVTTIAQVTFGGVMFTNHFLFKNCVNKVIKDQEEFAYLAREALKLARGGRGRGHTRTRRGIRKGLRSGAVAGKPASRQESLGSVLIVQNEQIASEAGVGIGIVPGVQIHLDTPPTPYFPQSYRDACISEFYMLEQGDMSISRYGQRFNELSRYVPFIVNDEEQRKMKFLKGIHPYYWRLLITSGASTYREVLSKALALEQNDVGDRKSKDLRGQPRQNQGPKKGKAVQTQYDSLGSMRQRFEGTSARVMYGQILRERNLPFASVRIAGSGARQATFS